MDELLHFAEHELHAIGLAWMVAVYGLRVVQFARLPWPGDRAPAKGSRLNGVFFSYASAFFPWAMESSRKHPWRWLEFFVYHLGAFSAIFVTFALALGPAILIDPVRYFFAGLVGLAAIVGVIKVVRRISTPELRLVSTPDDYFSLVALEFFFVATAMILLADTLVVRLAFFLVVDAYLFYVPLSKVSHYVYFFTAAVVTGARYGLRGIRPRARGAA